MEAKICPLLSLAAKSIQCCWLGSGSRVYCYIDRLSSKSNICRDIIIWRHFNDFITIEVRRINNGCHVCAALVVLSVEHYAGVVAAASPWGTQKSPCLSTVVKPRRSLNQLCSRVMRSNLCATGTQTTSCTAIRGPRMVSHAGVWTLKLPRNAFLKIKNARLLLQTNVNKLL